MPERDAWWAFVGAALVLAATPGPGVLFIVARTLAEGRRAGLASVLGVALGNLGNACGAALGVATLFALVPRAQALLHWAGAAWLAALAWQAIRPPAPRDADGSDAPAAAGPATATATAAGAPASPARLLRDGAAVALLNPKTLLFFAALLPAFAPAGGLTLGGQWLLGAVFVAIAAMTDAAWVLAAAAASRRLQRQRGAGRAGRWLSAGVYLGLAWWAALGAAAVGA